MRWQIRADTLRMLAQIRRQGPNYRGSRPAGGCLDSTLGRCRNLVEYASSHILPTFLAFAAIQDDRVETTGDSHTSEGGRGGCDALCMCTLHR